MMLLRLYGPMASVVVDTADPANEGYKGREIDSMLTSLYGRLLWQGRSCIVEEGARSDDPLALLDAAAELAQDIKVVPSFGIEGQRLGREVPALFVYEDKQLVGVYPHQSADGEFVTIHDYLADTLEALARNFPARRPIKP